MVWRGGLPLKGYLNRKLEAVQRDRGSCAWGLLVSGISITQ